MKVKGVDVCFDRVFRLDIIFSSNPFAGNKAAEARSGSNIAQDKKSGKYIMSIEYNPLSDAKKIARIDCKCETMIAITDSEHPSYVGEFKLYNITDDIANAIASYGNTLNSIWGKQKTTFTSSNGNALINAEERARLNRIARSNWNSINNSIPMIHAWWGYANHENPDKVEWHDLFVGYIQSSFSERKGEDYVTTLQCWEFNREIPSSNMDSYISSEDDYDNTPAGESYVNEDFWSVVRDLICKFEVDLPTEATIKLSNANESFSVSAKKNTKTLSTKFRTASTQKQNEKVFGEKLITRAVKSVSSNVIDMSLKDELNKKRVTFNTNGETNITRILKNLCDQIYLEGKQQIAVRVDKSMTNGTAFYYSFYKCGKSSSGAKRETITIVNYKNVVIPPAIQGNGSLVVKTMVIPDIVKYNTLEFVIEQATGNEDSTSFTAMPTVSYTGSTGNTQPIMTGIYNATILMQDANNKGNIFTMKYTIWKIVYELSTHGKEWYNTIYTMPAFTGSGS